MQKRRNDSPDRTALPDELPSGPDPLQRDAQAIAVGGGVGSGQGSQVDEGGRGSGSIRQNSLGEQKDGEDHTISSMSGAGISRYEQF